MWKVSNAKYVSSTEAEQNTRYIYLGKRFHFGKLYSSLRSQMTGFPLSTVNKKNAKLFSGLSCMFTPQTQIHIVLWKYDCFHA